MREGGGTDREGKNRGILRSAALILLFTGVQFAAEYAGLSWQGVQNGVAAPVWIGTAVAVTIVFFGGYRYLPSIAAGALLASLATDASLPPIVHVGSALASTCEAAVDVALLRYFRFSPSLGRLRDVAVVVFGAGLLGAATSATLGVGSLLLGDVIAGNEFAQLWTTWWFSNATSAVVLAPMLLLVFASLRAQHPEPLTVRWSSFAPSLGALAVVSTLIFLMPGDTELFVFPFIVFPFALFLAIRFGPIGAISSNLTVAAIALAGTYMWVGPFGSHAAIVGDTLAEALSETQVFVVALAVSTLALAATIAERETARETARDAERRYRSLVEHMPAGIYLDAVEDPDTGRITTIYVSPEIERVFGFAAEEYYADGELWPNLRHPDDRDRAVADDLEHYRNGMPLSIESRMFTRDGRELWIREEAVLLHDIAGYERVSQGVVVDITELMRTRDERERLREKMVNVQEEERRRIAADIHDDSVQQMAAVGLRLGVLRKHLAPASDEEFAALEHSVEESIARLRHLMFELRPPALDTQGLAAAIEGYLSGEAKNAGFRFEVRNRLIKEPDSPARSGLYRMAQEAIRNVVKHADADHVVVSVGPEAGGVSLKIADDGRGLPPEAESPVEHFGLAGIRERAAMLGGSARIESIPAKGTTVEVWVPD